MLRCRMSQFPFLPPFSPLSSVFLERCSNLSSLENKTRNQIYYPYIQIYMNSPLPIFTLSCYRNFSVRTQVVACLQTQRPIFPLMLCLVSAVSQTVDYWGYFSPEVALSQSGPSLSSAFPASLCSRHPRLSCMSHTAILHRL